MEEVSSFWFLVSGSVDQKRDSAHVYFEAS
jgi:hypothetical protein